MYNPTQFELSSIIHRCDTEFKLSILDCGGAVASVRDSYTDDPSSIPVRLVAATR